MIPIYKPYFTKKSLSYAHDAIDSSWVSSHGKYLALAEEKIQDILNVKHVLLLNNGTSATHLLSHILKNNIKKIIIPNNVFVAAVNSFLYDNRYELITVDADIETWNFDLNKLDECIINNPGAAVLIVHNIGNIINVPNLKIKYPAVSFIEDNCEGFLGKYNNIFSGTASIASSISFFGNKNVTSGEGGAFISNNEESYLLAKCLRGQGQSSEKFVHDKLGYNYRMTNIQAAILYGQLEILNNILERKQYIINNYLNLIKDNNKIIPQKIEIGTSHSNWMFGVRVVGSKGYHHAEAFFNRNKIEIRPMFYPLTAHNYIKNNKNIIINNCENAVTLNKECIILPSFPELSKDEQNYIIKTLFDYIKE